MSTDDRGLLRQQLYRSRAEMDNPELDFFVIILPEDPSELWIVRRDADE